MIYPENIHPWTITWFESLPQSYQYLDRSQKNPAPPPWDGLNRLPFEFTEAGGWNVQYDGDDGRDISQDFVSTPGEKVHYQLWVNPALVTGGSVYVYAFLQGGGDLLPLNGAESLVNVTEPGLVEGWFYPPFNGNFTFLISAANATSEGSTLGGSGPLLDAVNISRRIVNYAELPRSAFADGETFHPLLRYMDGIGQIGGQYRKVSDDLWEGIYTNPDTCPDDALRWLAQMMGIHRNVYGVLTNKALRGLLKRTAANGLAAIGSRSSLQEIFKSFLTGEQTCNVVPHPTEPHTIRVRVVLDEVPGGNLAALGEKLRASGTVPAGHLIQVVEGIPTWDQWESAAGATWNDYEANASTWSESDTLGLTFD